MSTQTFRAGVPLLSFKRDEGNWEKVGSTTGGVLKLEHYLKGPHTFAFEFCTLTSKSVFTPGEVVSLQVVYPPDAWGVQEVEVFNNLTVEKVNHLLPSRNSVEMWFYRLEEYACI